jgi:hypothetical protein
MWLQGASPETKEAIADVMSSEFARLMQREGVRAFESLRSSACAHESGHAIIETILGGHVKSVEIFPCPEISAWGGLMRSHDNAPWRIDADTPAIEVRHRLYRIVAGFVGEYVLDPGNVRSGSSLDERVVAQLLAADLHWREERSGHPKETWRECWDWVRAAIERNEDIGRQLAAKLDAVKCVKGKPLDAILRRVRVVS